MHVLVFFPFFEIYRVLKGVVLYLRSRYMKILTYNVSKCHYVIFSQGQGFNFGKFSRLMHVGNDFSEALKKKGKVDY